MSIRHVCDFCGQVIPLEGEDPCAKLGGAGVIVDGVVDQRHYCSAFQSRLDENKKLLDEAHDQAVKLFRDAESAAKKEMLRDV